MDSEDSRDDSSGSESNDNGPLSPDSVKSHGDESNRSRSRSRSRSSTPSSRAQSAASQHSSDSVKSANSQFDRSRSSSTEKEKVRSSLSPSSPVSPKSPSSPKSQRNSKSPVSPRYPINAKSTLGPKSPVESRSPLPPISPSCTKSQISPKSPLSPRSPSSPKSSLRHKSSEGKSPSPSKDSSRSSSPANPSSPKPDSPPRINQLPLRDNTSASPQSRTVSPSPERDNASVKSYSSIDSRTLNNVTPPPEQDNTSEASDGSFDSRTRNSVSPPPERDNTSVKSYGSLYSKTLSLISRSRSSSSDSSSSSVDSSSRKNKNVTKTADTQPEEISDGDIDLDQEKDQSEKKIPKNEINISHEDLSDVSDQEDSMGDHSEEEMKNLKKGSNVGDGFKTEDRNSSHDIKKIVDTTHRSEEAEEQLDFEAEDGECEAELPTTKDKDESDDKEKERNGSKGGKTDEKVAEEKEELEEGEVTDEDDVRPEETEPRPKCRFFSKGQCTWGASCRFLHPGVTDKGNYTMFELIRPVMPGEFGRDDRLYGKVEPPLVESAWERGLRTAKEMLRKSSKRKEQDIDFEEKKMNLSLAQEEFDKENGYYGRVASPEPRYVRHVTATDYPIARPQPDEYYGPPRRQIMYEPEYAAPIPRERARPYRELPSHRMPDYYDDKYGAAVDDAHQSSKKGRGGQSGSKREVIVQRVAEERADSGRDRERQAQGRGDEWSDPWMRLRSPAGGPGRRRTAPGERKRSYSSGSSYSSSSSSRSSSESSRSTYKSRSNSPRRRRSSRSRRRSRHVSPSVIVSERKAANERAALMNPPAPKRRAPSPGMMRVSVAANPPAPSRDDRQHSRSKLAMAAALARVKGAARRRSSRSSSASSASSSSDSDSSDSSSSSSRGGSSPSRRAPGVDLSLVKAMDALKGGSLEKKQIKLNLKTPVGVKKSDIVEFARKTDPSQAKKRPANSPPPGDSKSKKATSRREELLKQLKAVEDAIAKKRSKVN